MYFNRYNGLLIDDKDGNIHANDIIMALTNLSPHLIYDQYGDLILDLRRYLNVSVYCAVERSDMDWQRHVFDQLMKGSRFFPLLHHMAVTKELGMIWNFFKDKAFVDMHEQCYLSCLWYLQTSWLLYSNVFANVLSIVVSVVNAHIGTSVIVIVVRRYW